MNGQNVTEMLRFHLKVVSSAQGFSFLVVFYVHLIQEVIHMRTVFCRFYFIQTAF